MYWLKIHRYPQWLNTRTILFLYFQIYPRIKFLCFCCTHVNCIIFIDIHHHHHHVVPLAWISLTLSRHFSLSFIASGKSSGLHPVSSHSCCMYVRAGHPAFAWPYAGVHRSTSLMCSSLLLQQCPECLVRLVHYNSFDKIHSIYWMIWYTYMEVNNGNESDNMKKIEKQSIQKWWIYYKVKLTLKCFSFRKPSSGLGDGETSVARTIMNVLMKYDIRGK